MRKTAFFRTDCFLGLLVTCVMLAAARSEFLLDVERAWSAVGVFLLVSAYLMVVLPRLSVGVGATATVIVLAALFGARFANIVSNALWIPLLWSASALLVGHLLLLTKRCLIAPRGQAAADRQPEFCDFVARPDCGEAAEQAARPANPGAGPAGAGFLPLDCGALTTPMLGPYLIEKALARGAMGVVYLGRDPKSDRIAAIKTMALSQDFDADELSDVKERFLREAHTAGRLSHPNIVTIYGAGEDRELAYIAMEFLQGGDLQPFTKPDHLLPLAQVVSILARVADALAYAHSNNVVHRDVKPANIMYEPESDRVKVTDFGIARLTDSSKTRVGMVLGTPSYMSPEQLSGRKIDGRSDLFSLGVTLYQMVCGRLPFVGDSMARLMFKIAREVPADVRAVNPKVPDALAAIIDRALNKEITQRYQGADEMARDLRASLMPAQAARIDI